MKKLFSKKLMVTYFFIILLIVYVIFSRTQKIEQPDYGVSFNALYAKELGLNWKDVYQSIITDLQVKRIRLSAFWSTVESQENIYNFDEMDYQIQTAENNNVAVILAIGKRLPRWPECHVPEWAKDLNKEQQEQKILDYLQTTVTKYQSSSAITMWQIENEPFLSVYATDYCHNFDKEFLNKEIKLVHSFDSKKRPIMITDSGELSTWRKAFKMGDVFGTTVYVYSYNKILGQFRNPFIPGFYSFRSNILNFIFNMHKESIIAELSLEPWLDKAIINEKSNIQIERMSPEKFNTVIEFAKQTGMKTQYLWGTEWWYYMNIQGESWYWNRARELFK